MFVEEVKESTVHLFLEWHLRKRCSSNSRCSWSSFLGCFSGHLNIWTENGTITNLHLIFRLYVRPIVINIIMFTRWSNETNVYFVSDWVLNTPTEQSWAQQQQQSQQGFWVSRTWMPLSHWKNSDVPSRNAKTCPAESYPRDITHPRARKFWLWRRSVQKTPFLWSPGQEIVTRAAS